MTAVNDAYASSPSKAECMYVKWNTPSQELISVARLAAEFQSRQIADPNQICVAAPSITWALQVKRAFESIGAKADLRIPGMPLSPKAKSGLAMLALVADPNNQELRNAWVQAGRSQEELDTLASTYASASAAALLNVTGLNACPELESALLHVRGDENPTTLRALILDQVKQPTAAYGVHQITIVPYSFIDKDYEQLFVIGCVDGLVPAPANEETTNRMRDAFLAVLSHGRKRIFISGFAKMPVETAQSAHICFGRTKTENGKQLAMIQPSPFLAEFGADRPSSLGGQALLRMYGLN